MRKSKLEIEKRRFVRIAYVLPVEFYLVSSDHKKHLSNLIQGFTRNVSRGGLCLEINNLKEELALSALSGKANLLLYINLPFLRHSIKTYGRVVWLKKAEPYPHRFLLGVSYLNLNLSETAYPVRFARSIRLFNKAAAVFFILLFLGLTGTVSSNVILQKTNKRLVNKLVQVSKERSKISQEMFYLEDLKEILKEQLKESQLKKAYQDIDSIKNKLADLEEGKTLLQKRLGDIKKKRVCLEEKTIKKMYHWLKIRQSKTTGLVLSYEGSPFLKEWAFTYDQALVIQCFLLFNDFKSAQRILDFYEKKAKKVDSGFANAYDQTSGYVVEYTVHSGPNIWLGLSALQYINHTGDKGYLPFVKEIADWIIDLQNEDPEGGIRGGPKVTWFSTEHNLDAYAFFANLYQITGDKKYLEVSQSVLLWLKENAYIKAERRLKRGRGDATIATDTFSWAIAALGPAQLEKEEISPDEILEFAEENCKVTVECCSPMTGLKEKITGFDFAKARNIGRGGVVSTECTAQMVVSFKLMRDFYLRQNNFRKAKLYQDKAEFFLTELDKLTINSTSKSGQGAICLPYATHQNVDTGHGWRTPSGRKTGSIAGTVYTIFAKRNFNPFEFK